MIKLVFCVRRLADMPPEKFHDYWLNTHGPLVRKHAEALRIKRYVQVHRLDHPLNDALRTSRGGGEAYDGVAELWWESAEDLGAALSTEAGHKAGHELAEDERRFIDHARSTLWIGEEQVIV